MVLAAAFNSRAATAAAASRDVDDDDEDGIDDGKPLACSGAEDGTLVELLLLILEEVELGAVPLLEGAPLALASVVRCAPGEDDECSLSEAAAASMLARALAIAKASAAAVCAS